MLPLLLVSFLSVAEALKANQMICWDHAPTVETNVLVDSVVTKGLERYRSGKVINAADADNHEYRYSLEKPTYNEVYEQLFEYNFDPEKLFQAKGKFMGYYEYDRLYTIYFVCPKSTVQCGLFCCPNSSAQQDIIAASYFTDSSDIRRIDSRTTVTVGPTTYALIKTDQQCEYKLQSSDQLYREVRLDNGKPISSVYFDCAANEYCCQLGCRRNMSAITVEYARMLEPSSLKARSGFSIPSLPLVSIFALLVIALVCANYALLKKVRKAQIQKPEKV